jgi:pimeloyl-ACP methyl ester carboxylesterase/DNA-binding CsgD family transcriptional regulator
MARTAFPRDLAAAFGLSEIAPEPLFALAILNDDAPAGERTRESLGLTRAEWRLADQVKKGISVTDAAAESGISVNTARTQLKSAFAKLGVARQSELVSRLNLAGRIDAAPQAEPDLPAHAPPRRFVLLDDGRCLAYREYGDPFGKPVIHFHQWFTASILPLAAIKAVRKSGLRFLVFDRPGFGQSAPLAAHSFEAVARDVAAFADKLKLSRFAVMGTAPGGAFAVAAALAMPERVTKLALIAPRLSSIPAALAHGAAQRSLIGVLRHPWIIRPIVATLRAGMSDRLAASLLRHACADADSDRKIVDDPAAVRWIKSMAFDAHETSIAGMVAELELYAGSEFPHPGRLRCPIAAWHGAGDTVIPLDAAREVLDPMPNAAVHVLPGVAVLFPEAAYRTIFEWLEE